MNKAIFLLFLLPLASAYYVNVSFWDNWNNTQPGQTSYGWLYWENSNTTCGFNTDCFARMVAGSGNGIWKPDGGNDMLGNSTQLRIFNFTAYIPLSLARWPAVVYGSNQTPVSTVTLHGSYGMLTGSRGTSLSAVLYPDVKLIGTVYRDTDGETEFTWTLPSMNASNLIRFVFNSTYTTPGSDNFYVNNLTIQYSGGFQGAFYSQNETNGTYAGKLTKHSIYWADAVNTIQNYTFSYDNSNGTLINDSVVGFAGGWANVTKTTNSTLNIPIRWQWYVYSKTGAIVTMNNTPVYTSMTKPVDWFVSAYDENSLTTPKQFTLVMSNSTNTTTFNVNYQWFNKTTYEVPTGLVTLTATNASCMTGNVFPRQTTWNTASGALNWTVLFLCDGQQVALQTISVISQGSQGIPGATVTILKTVNGANVTVESKLTDGVGLASFYLTSLASYWVVVSASGYNSYVMQLTATTGTISIPLSAPAGAGGFDDINLYFNWTLYPDYLPYPEFTVNATVAGTGLNFYALNVSLANGSVLYFQNNTDSTGGSINSIAINRTDWRGTVWAILTVGKTNYTTWSYTRSYSIMNYSDSNSSVTGIIAQLKASEIPPSMKMTAAVFFSFLFATGGAFAFGAAGAGMAFIASFAFFGLVLGFVENNLFYLILIVGLSIYAVLRGL